MGLMAGTQTYRSSQYQYTKRSIWAQGFNMRYTMYGVMLLVGIIAGIFAAEMDVDNHCSSRGIYNSMFYDDVRCAPIVKVSTMEEAKKQVEMYQSEVRG